MMYTGEFSRGHKPGKCDPGRRYYRDTWHVEYRSQLEGRCANKPIRADAIEADVWDEIEEPFSDLERLATLLKEAQQSEDDKLKSIRDNLQITQDFIKHTEEEADKTARALRDAEPGGAVYESLKRDEKEVNEQLNALSKQREKYIAQLGARKLMDDVIETIMRYARDVKEGISNPTFGDKRRYLELLDAQVTVTPGHYHIKCLIGEKDGEISQMKRGSIRIVRNSC
jgi:hypothetical protein